MLHLYSYTHIRQKQNKTTVGSMLAGELSQLMPLLSARTTVALPTRLYYVSQMKLWYGKSYTAGIQFAFGSSAETRLPGASFDSRDKS